MDDIAALLAAREFSVDGVVFADEGFVDLADEVLRQWYIFQSGLLLHHLQAYVAGFHFFEVFHLCFAGDLAEEKEELCLSVGEGVAFDVVAVEVEVNGEFAAEPLPVAFRERLYAFPSFYCFGDIEVSH